MVPRADRALQDASDRGVRPAAEDVDGEDPEVRAARACEIAVSIGNLGRPRSHAGNRSSERGWETPRPLRSVVLSVASGHGEKLAVEHPAAFQRIEGIGVPSAAFVDQAVYIRTVRAGLSGEVVKQTIDAIGHRDFFVRLLGTTSGHLNRLYGRKSLGPARTEGLLDALRIFAAAAAAFGGLERAQDWLVTALPALGGDRPIDLCDTFEGRRLVREIVRKVEYGEFP